MGTETFEFKTEAQQLLDLMIHSLYSNKEIFLRELISNASDALDKRRFEALTDESLMEEGLTLGVRISADPKARTMTISDNGIGMTRDEVIQNLGTIAHSATKAFAERVAEAKIEGSPEALIGQFGVGFYSTFMVANNVEVITRRAGTETASRWQSTGDGKFTIEDAERDVAGTTITLTLRDADPEDDLPDFSDTWTLRRVVKKYNDFVTYPIELRTERTEIERDDEGNPVEGAEEKTVVEWNIINSMKAIWTRSKSDVTEEEYAEFYKHIGRDWEPPFETIRFRAEGLFEYDALIFIPSRVPFDMFYRDSKFGLQLYVNRVLIMENTQDLLPDWLRFIKGVVDSPDLSLNVSREILQKDRRVGQIKKRLVKKVLAALTTMLDGDRARYETFWTNFGRVLKEGVMENADALKPLLLFQSSNDPEAMTSFAQYVERMKDGQDAIYYLTGDSRAAVENSPHLEAFNAKGYEVLYLIDPVDEVMVGTLTDFDEHALKSIGKGAVELGTEEEKKAAEQARTAKQEAHASLLEKLASVLEEHVKEVRLSSRLTTSAVCLVGEEGDLSPGLEKMLQQTNQGGPAQKRILEINPDHSVLARLQTLYEADADDSTIEDFAWLLHGQALLAEGSLPPDPVAFTRRVASLMV